MCLRKLVATDANDYAALVARLAAGLIMLPHGLQKTVGWFGGGGFAQTMEMMTGMGLPAVIVFLVIVAESLGAISLIVGFLTRWSAFWLGFIIAVAGFMHASNGLFMNWDSSQAGEGFEFHILYVALCIIAVLRGSGAWSVDAWWQRSLKQK